jgi:hypothetical protein
METSRYILKKEYLLDLSSTEFVTGNKHQTLNYRMKHVVDSVRRR